jgi:hypothetical protein
LTREHARRISSGNRAFAAIPSRLDAKPPLSLGFPGWAESGCSGALSCGTPAAKGAQLVRVFLIFILILLVAAAGGFFYLVRQADAGAPAPHEAEVEIDVDLSR